METLDEFLHRITIEQQEADRYDRMQKKPKQVKCGRPQKIKPSVILMQMKGN